MNEYIVSFHVFRVSKAADSTGHLLILALWTVEVSQKCKNRASLLVEPAPEFGAGQPF